MTAYYVTFGIVSSLLILSELVRRRPLEAPGASATSTVGTSLVVVACALLAIMAGLRWRVGSDYGGYARNYSAYQDAFVADLRSFNEPGIKALAIVSSRVFDDYATFILLASLITVGLMLRTIVTHSPAVAFSVALFVLAGTWHGTFNGVRQYLACAIVLAGHRFVIDRKPVHFGLVVLAAGLFHLSALVAVALYFVPRRKMHWAGLLAIVGVSLAALYSSDAVLGIVESVKGEELTTVYVTAAINPLRIAVAVVPLALYAVAERGDDRAGDWFYRNMAVVHASVMIAASWSAYLGRFGIYTAAFIPLILPRLVRFSNPTATFLARLGVLVLFGIYWFSDVAPSPALNDFRWVFDRAA